MVETISPVVYGARSRWIGAVALHAAGALLGAPWGRAGAAAVVGVALVYAARELFGLRVPVPQLRRQVPDWWRTYFGPSLTAAFLYGAGLGIGFLTFLGHGTLVAVAAAVAATGEPLLGAAVMAPFGLARGLAPLVAMRSAEPEDGGVLVDRLSDMDDRLRSVLNGAALLTIAVAAAVVEARGGWTEAAAALLAVAFGWAAATKVLRPSRWRAALAAHRLPGPIEHAARWAVPLVEALVPVLTVFGRERAAAITALVALLAFSSALVRSAIRAGVRVPCGCFGRASVDVRAALLRNGALATLAGWSWLASAADAPLPIPTGSDALPASLVAAALVAAVLTAWRATSWLGRGRA